jgi:hypothetical protein
MPRSTKDPNLNREYASVATVAVTAHSPSAGELNYRRLSRASPDHKRRRRRGNATLAGVFRCGERWRRRPTTRRSRPTAFQLHKGNNGQQKAPRERGRLGRGARQARLGLVGHESNAPNDQTRPGPVGSTLSPVEPLYDAAAIRRDLR